jgi:hypothetical protein
MDLNEASLMKTEETPAELGEDTSTAALASRTGAGFLAGIVFGVFLGAGLALFFAPDRGDKTRNKLRRRMRSRRGVSRHPRSGPGFSIVPRT